MVGSVEVVLSLRGAKLAAHALELEERAALLGGIEGDGPLAGQGGVILIEGLELRLGEASGCREVGDCIVEANVEVVGVRGARTKRSDLPEELLGEVDGVGVALKRSVGVRCDRQCNPVGSRRGRSVERVDDGFDEVEKLLAKERIEKLHGGGAQRRRVE